MGDQGSATTISVVGFDSAWTDNPRAPGAICVVRLDTQGARLHVAPRLASFSEAATVIRTERSEVGKCLVALDQPTIVPNLSGSRPVDKVAGALISWVGGGVQPANRSKLGMFDDAAPIWRFKQAIGAIEDPEAARAASSGLFLIEVFPALALVVMESAYCQRYGAPKYNPANRKMFKLDHWLSVAETIRTFGSLRALEQLELWCSDVSTNLMPRKADQDKVDAMICGLVGLHWLLAPRDQSVMIGDLDNGYMIAPAVNGIHERLVTAARKRNVPIR
ncbi:MULTISPECIES: DUF429 domain-containing protein [Rhizobium]|uniref:DUF429 domain-containing protein n=1 Tax=Rhizobium TaxID=379 RepID=UPI000BEA02AB|nr:MULTISPECIES: DUF429 domain-containing protein [unclassified Rhizobium]MBY4591746.1 DUF429 domain-containing protein [Rhizobium redzepovicii]MBY4613191.1 DUF429 domain-containing protein [Rhizobium redzepovicii]MDF0657989.1 DUF429 domain-containing protein [Rhizobium sp. BC49]PDS88162.1 DUF429 domain-containing protein [Rhizobium sp. L18]